MPEDIDTTDAVSDTATSTEPESQTGSVDTSTDVTQSTTTNTAESSTDAGSTDVVTQVASDAQATQSAETTNTNPHPEIDYKARYASQLKSWQQERAEKQAIQAKLEELTQRYETQNKQYQGIQPQEIEQFRAQQKVPVWDETSPGHQQFLETRKTYEHYERKLNRAPDDATKQWLMQEMNQDISPEEAKTLREWKADVRRQEWERQTNPAAYYRKLIQKEAQPVIQDSLRNVSQTYQSVQSAQQEVQSWLKDNPEIASQANVKAVFDLMSKGETFSVAAARVERDHFRSLVSTAHKAKASAEEKERLLQGNAAGTIARNPQTGKFVDYKQVAKEKGLTNERDRMDLLFELDGQGQLGR